ncbi:hypothetical protein JKF63_06386 [Porcisia hertigi]|uniref:Uncharacterized protein n=1 Tax=Porcisia hertigi TaxID=2761500 RepID=A0A836YG44_9TRYP|nr:hypothetical protein JKF63_06386 [Porcisia hertigi]
MRCSRVFCARKDIVELLMSRGRLADIQMLNFYSVQLDRLMSTASGQTGVTPTTAANTGSAMGLESIIQQVDQSKAAATTLDGGNAEAASPNTVAAPAAEAEGVAKAAAAEAQRLQSREARTKAWKDFQARSARVRQLAANENPVAWVKEVYGGGEELSCSCLALSSAVVTRASDSAPTSLKVSGIATVAHNGDVQAAVTTTAGPAGGQNRDPGSSSGNAAAQALPKSIRVVFRLESGADDMPKYVTASVPLDQPGAVEQRVVNGVLRVHLKNADAVQHESPSAEEVMSHQHVLTATAYSTILRKVGEVSALHATNSVRYDALRIRNPAVQMRLAQLECFQYGIDCLTDYVVGDPNVFEDGEDADLLGGFSERLQIPLIESLVLKIYAQRAFMDGMDGMWETVRDTPLVAAVAHRSNPAKMIDYPYLARLLNSSKYLLLSSNGSKEVEMMTFLHPLLSRCGSFGSSAGGSPSGTVGMFEALIGLTSGHSHAGVRLAAPHVNLAGMARALEVDVAKLLSWIASEKDRSEPIFVMSVAQYVSELLANLAVLYRCTAALNVDEEGRGHCEWLLAQAFGGASTMRRQRVMDDYTLSRAATTVIKKGTDLDNYSMHPIELMNALPRKTTASSSNKASGA